MSLFFCYKFFGFRRDIRPQKFEFRALKEISPLPPICMYSLACHRRPVHPFFSRPPPTRRPWIMEVAVSRARWSVHKLCYTRNIKEGSRRQNNWTTSADLRYSCDRFVATSPARFSDGTDGVGLGADLLLDIEEAHAAVSYQTVVFEVSAFILYELFSYLLVSRRCFLFFAPPVSPGNIFT